MSLIKNANKVHSVEEIAKFLCISVGEVQRYLEM